MAVQPFHEWIVNVECTYKENSEQLPIQTILELQMVNDVLQRWLANDIQEAFDQIPSDTILEGRSVVNWKERVAELENDIPTHLVGVRILLENCYACPKERLSDEQIIEILDFSSVKMKTQRNCFDLLQMKKFPKVISDTFTASVKCMTDRKIQAHSQNWNILTAIWDYFFPAEDAA